MSIRNFFQEVKYVDTGFQLPLTFRIGAVMDILDAFYGAHEGHSLQVAFNTIHPRDFSERVNLGAEYWFNNMIAFRGGYQFNHDVANVTGGLGFKYNLVGAQVMIDYAYTNTNYFDSVNRFSLSLSF